MCDDHYSTFKLTGTDSAMKNKSEKKKMKEVSRYSAFNKWIKFSKSVIASLYNSEV